MTRYELSRVRAFVDASKCCQAAGGCEGCPYDPRVCQERKQEALDILANVVEAEEQAAKRRPKYREKASYQLLYAAKAYGVKVTVGDSVGLLLARIVKKELGL